MESHTFYMTRVLSLSPAPWGPRSLEWDAMDSPLEGKEGPHSLKEESESSVVLQFHEECIFTELSAGKFHYHFQVIYPAISNFLLTLGFKFSVFIISERDY